MWELLVHITSRCSGSSLSICRVSAREWACMQHILCIDGALQARLPDIGKLQLEELEVRHQVGCVSATVHHSPQLRRAQSDSGIQYL